MLSSLILFRVHCLTLNYFNCIDTVKKNLRINCMLLTTRRLLEFKILPRITSSSQPSKILLDDYFQKVPTETGGGLSLSPLKQDNKMEEGSLTTSRSRTIFFSARQGRDLPWKQTSRKKSNEIWKGHPSFQTLLRAEISSC